MARRARPRRRRTTRRVTRRDTSLAGLGAVPPVLTTVGPIHGISTSFLTKRIAGVQLWLWLALGSVILLAMTLWQDSDLPDPFLEPDGPPLDSANPDPVSISIDMTTTRMTMDEVKTAIRTALRAAATAAGVDPDIADMIAKVESQWQMVLPNKAGKDGQRGGAWGPTQITQTTARGYGYSGPMSDLTTNLSLAASLTAKILAARPGGPPTTPEEAALWWNSGRSNPSKMPLVTRTNYLPKAKLAYAVVLSLGDPTEAVA